MKNLSCLLLAVPMVLMAACEKYLDAKPKSSLAVPTTLVDYQSLLDQTTIINEADVATGEASAGDFYLTDADYQSRSQEDQRCYTWQNSYIYAATNNDWANLYRTVYRANTVLDGAEKITVTAANKLERNNLLGQGYYIRGRCFLMGLCNWANAYSANAGDDLGIPLRKGIDFNERSVRSSVAEGYLQVISDLKMAAALLPVNAIHAQRASKPAAYGLLARAFLLMGNMQNAKLYSDSCLLLKNNLLDYNALVASATYPLVAFNAEVLTASRLSLHSTINPSRAKVVAELYNSYQANDLRKTVFFKNNSNGTFSFKGSYDGSAYPFSGLAVDEVLLTRAEANCRLDNLQEAMDDLNSLLVKRFKTGTYVPYTGLDKPTLLKEILQERRKELLCRGVRWPDIKRLNLLGEHISLTRTVAGTTYNLTAGSPRFAMPIPEDIIELSEMEQNSY